MEEQVRTLSDMNPVQLVLAAIGCPHHIEGPAHERRPHLVPVVLVAGVEVLHRLAERVMDVEVPPQLFSHLPSDTGFGGFVGFHAPAWKPVPSGSVTKVDANGRDTTIGSSNNRIRGAAPMTDDARRRVAEYRSLGRRRGLRRIQGPGRSDRRADKCQRALNHRVASVGVAGPKQWMPEEP